ncbi:hypothetical protein GDO78_022288 [Eleutherodactylus coqui]|uniref:Uncharacterized protein n=1 Tax=Eleutherodactylus coqui TaxID=57060 RepID=A0A8J6EG88_ELECQ|nr:hypothetical protein GDO78_022288 [Eleutherodactylus coqui]
MMVQAHPMDKSYLQELHEKSSQKEKDLWGKKGATTNKHGLYEVNKQPCLPGCLYPAVVQWAHGPAHLSKRLMNCLILRYFHVSILSPTAAAKNQPKQQVINRPQSSGAAAKNQQKQQVLNQPQSSGAAAKNQQKQQVFNQPQSSGAAAKNQQKQQVVNRPQSSGAAAKNQQKQQVINRPQSSGAPTAAAKNPQKQQVINQPQSLGVRAGQNPQQPTPPAVCHPASSKVTETKTQIGDMKKSEAAGKNSGATGSTPPNQKLNTSNPSQFKET